ncbi:MAG TPA: hypothetical protein VGA78_01130 [Gemmatimonadales bacterium]
MVAESGVTRWALSGLLLATLALGDATRGVAQPATDTSLTALYAAREKVWRDYFANGPDLAKTLPPGFLGIGAGDTAWADRASTLAGAKASAGRGTRLVALRFPRNRVERHGDVAIIHSRYEAELETGAGRNTLRGNITEVFLWTGTGWTHPSWHMDYDRPAASATASVTTPQRRLAAGDTAARREALAAYQAHQGEFDYLLGDWEFSGIRQRADGPVKIRGYWSATRSADGALISDEFRMVDDSGRTIYVSTTLRVYDPVQQRWNLIGVEPGGGIPQLGTAWKEGADMRIDQTFTSSDGTSRLWRIRYFNIGPDRFSWRADISSDGGVSWSENQMTMEGRRTGPARPPVALTPRRAN